MDVKNDIFSSEIGSGFGKLGGTPPPRIPRSTSPREKHFICKTAAGYCFPVIRHCHDFL